MVKETKFYDLLEVDANANDNELKRAHRRLYHPDRNPEAWDWDTFEVIELADQAPMDSAKRRIYDLHGEETPSQPRPLSTSCIHSGGLFFSTPHANMQVLMEFESFSHEVGGHSVSVGMCV